MMLYITGTRPSLTSQTGKSHLRCPFHLFSGEQDRVFATQPGGNISWMRMAVVSARPGSQEKKKERMNPPYSIIGTGVPYPPYGRGISRRGFIVGRLVAMISSEDRVYRTSPI